MRRQLLDRQGSVNQAAAGARGQAAYNSPFIDPIEIYPLIASLIRAERTYRQARSI